jgi:dTDP-4-amino-4,6-dideoxygalactose transaminase
VPFTDEYAQREVTLPLFATMTEPQVKLVVEAIRKAMKVD